MMGVKQSDCDEDDCTNPLLPSASKTESHRSSLLKSSSSSYASASVKDKYGNKNIKNYIIPIIKNYKKLQRNNNTINTTRTTNTIFKSNNNCNSLTSSSSTSSNSSTTITTTTTHSTASNASTSNTKNTSNKFTNKLIKNNSKNNNNSNDNIEFSATIIHNTTAFSKRKQFIILLIMVIILVYFNSSVTIWDKRNIEKIPVYHRSHVPGMKDETATEISQLSKSMIKKKNYNINNIDSSISDINDGIVINNNNKMKSLHPMNSDINGNNNNDIDNIFQKNTNTIIPTINNFNNNNNNDLLRNPTKTNDNNNNNIITKNIKTTNDIKLSSYIMKSTILNRIMTKTTTILPLSSQTSLQSVPLLFAQKLSSLPSSKLLLSSSMITKTITPYTTINTTTSTTNNTTANPILIIKTSTTTIPSTTQNSNNSIKLILPPGYLVWSDKCKMPNMDPFNPEIMKYFKRQSYKPCTTETPHTFISFNDTSKKYILHLNDKITTKYTKGGAKLSCFYQDIERSGTGKNSDRNYKLGKKIDLPKTTELPNTIEFILVTCKSTNNQIYMNVHSMIPEKDEIRIRLNEWKKKYNETGKKPISILFIGIDSISRLNLIRAMPKTAQYVYDNEWFELSGYNKIDDNTFPNLMAILAGLTESHVFQRYNPKKVGLFDKCPLLWKEFQRLGYVTAYAEDETSISTFNYLKNGFIKQPTDYYLRPSLMVAEKKLPTKMKNGLTFCVGYKHSADYILDYAYELGNRYKDDPYFGFFWMNTFSHNAISDSSSMDDRIVEYFKKFSDSGILNRSVIIFISDHGMRFGPTRVLESGYYEERLPLAFLWLPPWLKDIHPEFVNSLNINKNRLTNPYDMHMTLKHILQLSGRIDNVTLAEDCENCQTLFKPVPENRSCQDISIADHWCTCLPFQSVHKDSVIVKRAANYSINYINDYLHNFQNGSIIHLCAKLHLHKIKSANRAITTTDTKKSNNKKMRTIETYQIIMTAKPGDGLFESSVRYHPESDEFEVTGSISRLNWYGGDSKCLQDSGAKKYCYCIYSSNNNNNSNKNKIKNKNKVNNNINKSKNNKTSHTSTSG